MVEMIFCRKVNWLFLAYLRLVEIQAGAVGVILFLVELHLDAMRSMGDSRGVRRRVG